MTAVTKNTCVIACYYNPTASKVRLKNFIRFFNHLKRGGIDPYVVELTFRDAKSSLRGTVSRLFRVRSDSIIWQKERLLNRLISLLPARYENVAWVDVDLIFGRNPMDWLEEIARALDDVAVVQGFRLVNRSPRYPFGASDRVDGFACKLGHLRPGETPSGNYKEHGHTGYAWAAKRHLLDECGLYDCCLSGSGDHLMAHGFAGDVGSDCFNQVFRGNRKYRDHFLRWATRAAHITGGRIGFVDMEIRHLWHGAPEKRRYRQRDIELTDSLFDPDADLVRNKLGCWEWSRQGRRFTSWASTYFEAREEP